jgi:hypothetical protein
MVRYKGDGKGGWGGGRRYGSGRRVGVNGRVRWMVEEEGLNVS